MGGVTRSKMPSEKNPACAACGDRNDTVDTRYIHDPLAPNGRGTIVMCDDCASTELEASP